MAVHNMLRRNDLWRNPSIGDAWLLGQVDLAEGGCDRSAPRAKSSAKSGRPWPAGYEGRAGGGWPRTQAQPCSAHTAPMDRATASAASLSRASSE